MHVAIDVDLNLNDKTLYFLRLKSQNQETQHFMGQFDRKPFTLDVCCENATVCVPLSELLVVVNMMVRSRPFKVTAIWGLPSRVCILHKSHSSIATDSLYLIVATKT